MGAGIPLPWAHSEPTSRASSSASRRARSTGSVPEHVVRAPQADAAGEALAAALVGAEAQEVDGQLAHVGAVVEADDAPCPTMQPSSRELIEVEAESSCDAGRIPPSGPPICSAFHAAAVAHAPGQLFAELAQRRPEAHFVDAGAQKRSLKHTSLLPVVSCPGSERRRPPPLARDERDVGEGLRVVDHRGQAVQAPHTAGNGGRAGDGSAQPLDARRAARSPRRRRRSRRPRARDVEGEAAAADVLAEQPPSAARPTAARAPAWRAGTRSGVRMKPCSAPTAKPASAIPSSTSAGLRSIRYLSM